MVNSDVALPASSNYCRSKPPAVIQFKIFDRCFLNEHFWERIALLNSNRNNEI